MVTSLESQVAVIDRVVQMVIMIMVVVTQMIKREMQNSHIGLYHGHFYCYHHIALLVVVVIIVVVVVLSVINSLSSSRL